MSGKPVRKLKETPHPLFSDKTANQSVRDAMTVERVIEIDYTNWRGERGIRKLIPLQMMFKTSDHHKDRQWMIVGWDLDKLAWRSYPIKDIHNV